MWSTPKEHPYIKKTEAKLLAKVLVPRQKRMVPFLKIIKDRVIWGNVASHFIHSWLVLSFRYFTTRYAKEVLHYKVGERGFMALLVLLGMAASAIISGILSDYLYNRKKASLETMR